jgi:transcriptional regulator with XRE-family HTH domain
VSREPRSRMKNTIRVMEVAPQRKAPPQTSMARPGLPRTDLGPTALLVKLLRKVLLGCPQVEMSARSGVDADLISRYENGTILQPTPRNLDRLLSAAGFLDVKQPLLLIADQLSALLSPPPPNPPGDPLRLGELLQRTSQRLLQSDSRLLPGEYIPPNRRDLVTTALLARFLRAVLLGCSLGELARRTGIHRDVLSRYEAGRVRKPDPANLDRLLAEAQVLHLKEPLLRAMSGLSAVLSNQPQPATATVEPNRLSPGEVDAFLAFVTDLLHCTSLSLGLECEKFSPPVPGDGLDFREE